MPCEVHDGIAEARGRSWGWVTGSVFTAPLPSWVLA